MEAVGLALGVPGFIAVALQTYSFVVRSITSYQNLSKELEVIASAITREEIMFARSVLVLLQVHMAAKDRTELVQSRGDTPEFCRLHEQPITWEGRLLKLKEELAKRRTVEEPDGNKVDIDPAEFSTILFEMDLIKDVGNTLEAIKEIIDKYLRPREDKTSGTSSDGNSETVDPVVEFNRVSAFRRRLNTALQNTQKRKGKKPVRNKIGLLLRDIPFKLQEQLQLLEAQNKRLSSCIAQRDTWNSNNLRVSERPPTRVETPTAPRQSSDPSSAVYCIIRMYSSQLYQEFSKHNICCQQHSLCLCLHAQPEENTSITNGARLPPDVPTIRFTALVTARLPTSTTTARQGHIQNPSDPGVTGYNDHDVLLEIQTDLPDPNPPRCPKDLCEEILSNSTHHGSYGLGIFHLRHSRREPSCSTSHSLSPTRFNSSFITLRDLVLPESSPPRYVCDSYHRILIATTLVKAAISFHSSPWVRSWSARSIVFFRDLETSDDVEKWKPHITYPFCENDAPPCNTILRALAILLSEVAGVNMDMHESGYDPFQRVKDISPQMGREYKNMIKQLCDVYHDSLWRDGGSIDDEIDAVCFKIARELQLLAYMCNYE